MDPLLNVKCNTSCMLRVKRLTIVVFLIWICTFIYLLVQKPDLYDDVAPRPAALDPLLLLDNSSLKAAVLRQESVRQLRSAVVELWNYMTAELKQAVAQPTRVPGLIDTLRQHHQAILTQLEKVDNSSLKAAVLRQESVRQLRSAVVELWNYMTAELKQAVAQPTRVPGLIDTLRQHHQAILTQLEKVDAFASAQSARQAELRSLGETIQERLHRLQNPSDCSAARKIVCNLNKACGYACQIHHAAYCLIVAYGTNRTLTLNASDWSYSEKGWNSVFSPVTNCPLPPDRGELWSGQDSLKDLPVVFLPIIDNITARPPFLPQNFPQDIAARLLLNHGYPPTWWIGQMVLFLTRPSDTLSAALASAEKNLAVSGPCVGVHVRRTDKLDEEAEEHELSEYMMQVEDYFERMHFSQAMKISTRTVYLATDDPSLIEEAGTNYPDYRFISDRSIAESAKLSSRYTDASLMGIIRDVHFLSLSDYLVCTFSSQVCRLAYELMQVRHDGRDMSARFRSLDDVFYFGGQDGLEVSAWLAHSPQNKGEIELQPGDVVGLAGNHWNGFSEGINKRTGSTGLFPSYKVRPRWRIAKFPSYNN